MGSYTFTWEHGGSNVIVTGDFDAWGQANKLEPHDGILKKTVELQKARHLYKFVVDGVWKHSDTAPKENDGKGGFNNILSPEDIQDSVNTLSSAAPQSTTAALAGAVPKAASKSEESVPGAFPETPFETPATESQAFSINPIPATEGLGNPVKLAPGEKVPDPSTFTSNTIQSTVKDDKPQEESVKVAPIPATAGAGNPIHLAPGEKVPDPSTLTSNTISSTAKTDAGSYEKSDAVPPQLGPVDTPEPERESKGGLFSLPPILAGLIPESSLPKDTNTKTEKDPGVAVQSAAPSSTTAALAGQVPKEPKAVPEAVIESQKEAGFPPEASANAAAVEEKKEVEAELKDKVPVEPAAAESSTKETVGGTVAAAGATAVAGATALSYSAKEKTEETLGVNGQPTSSEVPEVVTESQKKAHVGPEASANAEAVEEKKEVEAELLKEVKKTNEAGEPAPTVTAAIATAAPGLSDDALADTKPLKSSSEPDALNASASTPAEPETVKPAADSRDISPMSKQPTKAETEQTQPTVTTGVESSKVAPKTTAPETPKKTTAESATGTPESVASGTTDKKKKRRSIFGKLKDKLLH